MAAVASKPAPASGASPKGAGARAPRSAPTNTGGSSGERRISLLVAGFMIGTAFVIDLFQLVVTAGLALLPIIGWFGSVTMTILFTISAACLFSLWFHYLGVKFLGTVRSIATTVGEIVPFFNILPGWTIGVSWTVFTSWAEDRTEKESGADGSSAQNQGEALPTPANDNAPRTTNDNTPPAANDRTPRTQSPFVDGIRGGRNNTPIGAATRRAA